ncbi:MAG: hypothetical protein AVDCRST_MAG26-387 [uncultured Chloroflexia bacterium]|uniref:Uncharacterized protein n=1 Tax=uncultured Chloroflexia bacterium TaxID=1672391 RepID=A0A6J4HBH4_9CHLR|nr:MAG: hypothetical protein AVDCRST_MAG26-387 [uncultured Chloroflexia bacterium]
MERGESRLWTRSHKQTNAQYKSRARAGAQPCTSWQQDRREE